MTEMKKVLTQLGWTDDLIDAFFDREPGPEYLEAEDFSCPAYVDIAEPILTLQTPYLQSGSNIKMVA